MAIPTKYYEPKTGPNVSIGSGTIEASLQLDANFSKKLLINGDTYYSISVEELEEHNINLSYEWIEDL